MTVSPPIPDRRELKKAFGNFLTGVTVVTTQDSTGESRGFTANSFTSVSLEPPLLLVCLDHSAACFEAFANAEHFAVNILSDGQRSISGVFASKREDKFSGLRWTNVHGSPVLEGSIAWFACGVHERIEHQRHHVGGHDVPVRWKAHEEMIRRLGVAAAEPVGARQQHASDGGQAHGPVGDGSARPQ